MTEDTPHDPFRRDHRLGCRNGLADPPFGISVFTVKSTLNDPNISVESIFAGCMPFLGAMLAVLVLVCAFPWLSLALV